MIVFVERANYLSIIRLKSCGQTTDNFGKFRHVYLDASPGITGRPEWIWDVAGVDYFRSWTGYETLNNSEKRQIIGMLDKLNHNYYRETDKMRDRWNQLIGRQLSEVTS